MKSATTDALTVWWANQMDYGIIAWRELIFTKGKFHSRFDLPHKPRLFVSQEGLPSFNHGKGAGDWGFASMTRPGVIFVQTGGFGAQREKERKVEEHDLFRNVIERVHEAIYVVCFRTAGIARKDRDEYKYKQSLWTGESWERSEGEIVVLRDQLDFEL